MSEALLRAAAEGLRAGDFPAAMANAEKVLAAEPASLPALAMGALAALRLGRRDEAEALMRRHLALTPQDHAVRGNLAALLVEAGRNGEALALVADHGGHHRLARLAGWLHQQAGEAEAAAQAYQAAVAAQPRDFEAWNNLGNLRAERGDRPGAAEALERAVSLGASAPEIFLAWCQVLTGVENRERRLRAAEEGLRRFPAYHELEVERALALAADWRMDEAIEALRAAAANEATFGSAHVELGLLYENLTRLDDLDALLAEAEARGLDTPEMDFLRAWSLRRKDRYEEAAAYAVRIPASINPLRTAQLRGEIADRLGDADTAFAEFTAMNRESVRQAPPPPGPTYREMLEASLETLPALAAPPPPPAIADGMRDPAFIVGFPRSGTTLLDTLLGAYGELQVFEEQPMLSEVREECPSLAALTDPRRLADARAHYRDAAERCGGPAQGRRILDKHPLHMTLLPDIHRLFPQADVVLVERHPCDAVLSCFIANFTLNRAMRSFTGLEEAARTYVAVFTHWERAASLLPVRVHRVRYERMVADLEGEMRPLVEFLGLDWRGEALDNQRLARSRGVVRTASYAQIGQPIYAHARERWRRYREHLEPVLPILAPWVEKLGYEL
ncbi:MAG: sulfotransferase [Sphingomonadales bacterium]|nr:sulfotransferase [Sphingomonadales bacterium]MDE2567890.1 sulfotransferase [Sphingomonadales bacterium]